MNVIYTFVFCLTFIVGVLIGWTTLDKTPGADLLKEWRKGYDSGYKMGYEVGLREKEKENKPRR